MMIMNNGRMYVYDKTRQYWIESSNSKVTDDVLRVYKRDMNNVFFSNCAFNTDTKIYTPKSQDIITLYQVDGVVDTEYNDSLHLWWSLNWCECIDIRHDIKYRTQHTQVLDASYLYGLYVDFMRAYLPNESVLTLREFKHTVISRYKYYFKL